MELSAEIIDLPETLDSMPDFLTPTTDKEKQSFLSVLQCRKAFRSTESRYSFTKQSTKQLSRWGYKTDSFLELEQMLNIVYGKEEDVATNYALDQEILNDISLLVEAANGDLLRSPFEDYVDKYSQLPDFNQDDDENNKTCMEIRFMVKQALSIQTD